MLLGTVDCRPPLVPTTTHQPPAGMRPEMVAIVAIHEAIEAAGARGGRREDVEDGAAPHLPDPALIPMHFLPAAAQKLFV